MSVTRGIAIGLLVTAVSTGPDTPAFAHDSQTPVHLSVAMCGAAHVPPAVMAGAMDIAAGVYRDVGVVIDWMTDDCDDEHLVVHLILRGDITTDVSDVTVGFAQPGTSAAMVLYDRIEVFARRHRLKRDRMLGYAIAHELGHLLLPPNSHSLTGVMQASLNIELAAEGRLRFTRDQGSLIVRRLETPLSQAAIATH